MYKEVGVEDRLDHTVIKDVVTTHNEEKYVLGLPKWMALNIIIFMIIVAVLSSICMCIVYCFGFSFSNKSDQVVVKFDSTESEDADDECDEEEEESGDERGVGEEDILALFGMGTVKTERMNEISDKAPILRSLIL